MEVELESEDALRPADLPGDREDAALARVPPLVPAGGDIAGLRCCPCSPCFPGGVLVHRGHEVEQAVDRHLRGGGGGPRGRWRAPRTAGGGPRGRGPRGAPPFPPPPGGGG